MPNVRSTFAALLGLLVAGCSFNPFEDPATVAQAPYCDIVETSCVDRIREVVRAFLEDPPADIEVLVGTAEELLAGEDPPEPVEPVEPDPTRVDVYHRLGWIRTRPDPSSGGEGRASGPTIGSHYDPNRRRVVIVLEEPRDRAREVFVLAALLGYAHQDFRYQLGAWFSRFGTTEDEQFALLAVSSGHSLLVALAVDASFQEVDLRTAMPWNSTYASLRDDLVAAAGAATDPWLAVRADFSFVFGFPLVANAWLASGAGALEPLFTSPPASTVAVVALTELRTAPPDPTTPPAPDEDGELVLSETVGGWDLALLLTPESGLSAALTATRGWTGARLDAFRSDDQTTLVLTTTWHTAPQADAFTSALGKTFANPGWKTGDTHVVSGAGTTVTLTVRP